MKYFKTFVCICFLIPYGRNDKNASQILVPHSYQLYCWDFFSCDDTSRAYSLVGTQVNVRPAQIINKEDLLAEDSSKKKCQDLYNLIFNSSSRIVNNQKSGIDSRFVILFNYSNHASDTIIYSSNKVLCLNDKLYYYYNFNMLDSLRHFFHVKKCFKCKYP